MPCPSTRPSGYSFPAPIASSGDARMQSRRPAPTRRPVALAVSLFVATGLAVPSAASPAAQLAWQAPAAMANMAAGVAAEDAAAAETVSPDIVRQYAIPPGPLSEVLTRFSSEAGVFVVGASDQARGKHSPGVQGAYSVQDGFAALLAGTGLVVFRQRDGSYSLHPAPASGATTLSAVTVSERRIVDPVTEGTGAYIATGPSTTATHLNMSLRETPQSISVITRQQMDDFGLDSMDEALLFTTGISVGTAAVGGGYQFVARGFNVSNIQVDGVQGSYREAGRGPFNPSVFDMVLYDRVEVVRGATGLVTGTGDPSATVNLVRKRPGKAFAASVAATAGSWDHRRLVADLSAPLTADGRVRTRLIGAYKAADAFRDFQSDRQTTASGTLEVDLTPATLLSVGHDFQATDLNGEANGGLPLFDSEGRRTHLPRSTSVAPSWTHWDKRYNNTFVSLSHVFANTWQLKAAYSRQKNTGDVLVTGAGTGQFVKPDGSGISLLTNLVANGYRHQDNLDIHATGPFTLFGRQHQLTIGANGTRSRDTSYTLRAENAPEYWIPNLYDWDGSMPEPGAVRTGAWTRTYTRQHGLYTGARFSLADPLHLIVGARLSNYRTYRHDYDSAGRYTGTHAVLRNKNELTPYAGITYDIGAGVTAYASYADLFKPQSYRDKHNDYLDPIVGSNIELGVKAALLNERVQVNVAVFKTEQDNLAVIDDSVPPNSLPDGGQAYVSSGPGNTSRGFELEASGEIVRGWQLFAAYSRTKTRDGAGTVINTYIPRQMFKLGTTYQLTGALAGLSVGSTVSWQSERDMWTAGRAYSVPGVGPRTASHASFALVGLHAGYRFDDHWQASLNVNNLFDKTYYDNFVAFRAQYGAPRNAQLTVRYQW